jgi:hypothetical protein
MMKMNHPFCYAEVQQSILASMDRDRVISWLKWNDRNGCYDDDDCDDEGLPRLDFAMAARYMRDQIAEF